MDIDFINKDKDINNILRKSLAIARKYKYKDLEKFINFEINGYDDKEDIPKYRKIKPNLFFKKPNRPNGKFPIILEDNIEIPLYDEVSFLGNGDLDSYYQLESDGAIEITKGSIYEGKPVYNLINKASIKKIHEGIKNKLTKILISKDCIENKISMDEKNPILHSEIIKKCIGLFNDSHYPESVEKSFKSVKDRLRELTGSEKANEAFKENGGLYIEGALEHLDKDFQEGVRFLAMAIDKFRNEKAHTSESKIDEIKAYQYLVLSSLMHSFLDRARKINNI